MLTIDPELTIQASTTLRIVADEAEETISYARLATRLSELQIATLALVLDLEDDLNLLSSILSDRANLAMGLRINTTGVNSAMESLLSSVHIEGDLAIYAAIADGKVTDAEWEGLTVDGLSRHASIETFEAYLQANEDLRAIEPLLQEVAATADLSWEADELREFLLLEYPEHTDLIERTLPSKFGLILDDPSDPEFHVNYGISVSPDGLLGIMIERGVFNHSPQDALDFIMALPNVETRETGFDMFVVGDEALQTIHEIAEKATLTLRERYELGMRLPETTKGYRNWVITLMYAEIGLAVREIGDNQHINNWSMIASLAAYSARSGIDGSDKILEMFGNTPEMRQSFANGNQRIIMSVMPKYMDLVELYENGDPTQGEIMGFLRTFGDGEADLRMAFYYQILTYEAKTETEAQLYQFMSNLKIGVHEQTLIEEDLNFGKMNLFEKIGVRLVSGIEDAVTSNPFNFTPPEIRSAGQYMADEGTLKITLLDGKVYEIPLDRILYGDDLIPESLQGVKLSDLDLTNEIEGLESISTAAEEFGVNLELEKWENDIATKIDVDDWTRFSDRIGPIANIFLHLQTDERLLEAVHVQAASRPPHEQD